MTSNRRARLPRPGPTSVTAAVLPLLPVLFLQLGAGCGCDRDTKAPRRETGDDTGAAPDTAPPSRYYLLEEADSIFWGEGDYHEAGHAVAGAGDVNGDGYDDIIVGAHRYPGSQYPQGTAYILYGPLSPGEHSLGDAEARIEGSTTGHQAGSVVEGAGDVNGDGYDDVLVEEGGITLDGAPAPIPAQVRLFLGPVEGRVYTAEADATVEFEELDDCHHWNRGLGDISGDGYEDLAVGSGLYPFEMAPKRGYVALLLGPVDHAILPAGADRLFEGEAGDSGLARACNAGDLNGDGAADLLLGATGYDGARGRTYIFLGPVRAGAPSDVGDADFALTGVEEWSFAGYPSEAGDLDGDGYDDFTIRAEEDEETDESSGVVYVFYGPVSASALVTAATAKAVGVGSGDGACPVGGDADFDGDGRSDLFIGAPGGSAEGSGVAYLVRGPVSGTVSLADSDMVFITEAEFGGGEALDWAGDLDADGRDDLVFGNYFQDTFAKNHVGIVHVFLGFQW